ncbi:Rpn family recombination-promoting nuclease/putative transposase [Hespellia stercorisuis]|uniref:Putative transposase, YhgA-like n=1 Tax=Hespellia stercorisuis DSM 15480 TaxID=1121950 RepID=A0A1M6ICG7_9FIRM|nr:Rpn family recombination-promoting nuclease/putative transposase [Hespellia stercorisuis]SHJ32131.1 Putative transposase, YhgA-like [Hespellia stercorisuis DSM 15480]
MGKANDTLNMYLSDPVRYADVVNHGLFLGDDVIDPKYLGELDSVEKNPDSQRVRDLKKKYKNQAIFLIIGVENQENIHYAMALRGLIYDTLSYQEQLRGIQKHHEEEKDLQGDEWLGRFGKDDKLIPVITVVLYYGNKPWDASLDLYGMIEIPEVLKAYQPMMLNYKLNLLEVAKIHDLDTYGDELKMVFGFVKYQRDKKALREFVEENQDLFSSVPLETCRTIEVLTNAKEITKYIEKDEDDKEAINMCEALQGMREDAKIEGKIEGKIENNADAFSLL